MNINVALKKVNNTVEREVINTKNKNSWTDVFSQYYADWGPEIAPFPDEKIHSKYNLFLIYDSMGQMKDLEYNIPYGDTDYIAGDLYVIKLIENSDRVISLSKMEYTIAERFLNNIKVIKAYY